MKYRPNFRRNSQLNHWLRNATIANAGREIGGERDSKSGGWSYTSVSCWWT